MTLQLLGLGRSIPDLDVEVLHGTAGQSCRRISNNARNILEFVGVGFQLRQFDHAEVEPAVGRFLDLCSESHLVPLKPQGTADRYLKAPAVSTCVIKPPQVEASVAYRTPAFRRLSQQPTPSLAAWSGSTHALVDVKAVAGTLFAVGSGTSHSSHPG
jgi:hypothetical protein